MAKGASLLVAKQQALALLDAQVMAQATALAFSRIYLLSGLLLCTALPLLFLFKTGKGSGLRGARALIGGRRRTPVGRATRRS